MTLRAIIAEDELLAREHIQGLAEDNGLQVVAVCSNGEEALAALQQYKPDLLFLDVQMPGLDGFEVLLAAEPSSVPAVIFTTAYDEYAVRAFDFNALDFLRKPFDGDRFRKAVDRAKARLTDRTHHDQLAEQLLTLLRQAGRTSKPEKLAIRSGGQVVLVRMNEIDWIETAGNYVRIHVGSETHSLRETMHELEARLDPDKFLRIHRCLMVNVDRIRRLEPCGNREYLVVMQDGKSLSLSRGYRDRLDRFLTEVLPQPSGECR